MSNPYSSAIDWHDANRSTFVDDYAYAYNEARAGSAGYEEINGEFSGAYIAANQGFFVIAANSTNFTFTNTMQTHNNATFYKGNTNNQNVLILRLTGNEYYDETKIWLKDESTYNRDRSDAIKMNSYNVNAPNLYTISADNINLAINSIPEIGVENSIPVGAVIPKTGNYTISITEVSDYITSNAIYLHDMLLNNWHKLSESNYNFTTDAGDIANRFVIHFGVLGVDEPTTISQLIQVWAAKRTINISNKENLSGKIKVLNMFGQVIVNTTLNGDNNQRITVNTTTGYYIVNIITNKGVVNKKVLLR